jgi:nicotinate phosphoribosyltransferase
MAAPRPRRASTDPGDEVAGGQPSAGAPREDIVDGRVAEGRLAATRQVLSAEGLDPRVTCEVRTGDLPSGWPWAVLCGLEEALSLLEGRDVDAVAVPEGSVIYPEEPVLQISGRYLAFVELETALLGTLGPATGVATAAAHLKMAAEGRPVSPMGLGRLHPSVVPVVERAAYVGGCDAVATAIGAGLTGSGTVSPPGPDLSLLLGEPEAWLAFDRHVDGTVPRLVTVGILDDERTTAVAAADALEDHLAAVHVEAPSTEPSRLVHLVRELRWELDAGGRSDVRILVSGDLDEGLVNRLAHRVDGFRIGLPLTAAPVVTFSFDIVEVEGAARSRRGTLSGRKTLWRCEACGNRGIAPARAGLEPCPRCEGRLRSLLTPRLRWGTRDEPPPEASAIRARALKEAAEAPSA